MVKAAGHIKRQRATRAEMDARRTALVEIVAQAAPTSVRHVYYRAVVQGLVEKADSGYNKVQRAVKELRETGAIDYNDIVDSTRWMRKPRSWRSAEAALSDLTASYRRAMWQDLAVTVEVWCESESVAGVLDPVIARYDVPCYPIKGQTSDSFCYSAAQDYRRLDKDVVLIYVGDFDPAGLEIESQLNAKLCRFSGRGDLELTRLGVTLWQADELQHLGTPPKKPHWRAADGTKRPFEGLAIEAEAIDAEAMRDLVSTEIEKYIPASVRSAHEVFERQEREYLAGLWGGAA